MIRDTLHKMPWAYREHIKRLVGFLLSEVQSTGGDGDAIWIVKNIPLDELRLFIMDECLTSNEIRFWKVSQIVEDEHGRRFSLGNNQESLTLTTTHKHVPSWSQCTITV